MIMVMTMNDDVHDDDDARTGGDGVFYVMSYKR
jgi:hypothetical protein